MLETACRLTVSTRRAANATAAAVVSFAALYAGSTQIADVRAVSPFADDPFDAVVSFAVIGLALVVGATWLRSISSGGVFVAWVALLDQLRLLRPNVGER
jgi:hypothetical protein